MTVLQPFVSEVSSTL